MGMDTVLGVSREHRKDASISRGFLFLEILDPKEFN